MPYWILYLVLPALLGILVRNKPKYHMYPFIFFMILSMIRYDTTSDYDEYVKVFWKVRNGLYNDYFEWGYVLLNKIFSFTKWGFIPLIALSIYIPFKGVLNLFKEHNILLWGTFVFITFGFITRYENIIRQGIAMGIFYYSLKYIKTNNLVKYSFLAILATFFHTSGIILFLYYFIIKFARNIKIQPFYSLAFVLAAYLLYLTGTFMNLAGNIFPIIPQYAIYAGFDSVSAESGFGVLYKVLLAWLPSFYFHKKEVSSDVRMVLNLSWISTIGFLIIHDFVVLDRIIEYLYIFQIISISLLFQALYRNNINRILLPLIIIPFFYTYSVFVFSYYRNYNYQSIFSEDCIKHRFYHRDEDPLSKRGTNRNYKVIINP